MQRTTGRATLSWALLIAPPVEPAAPRPESTAGATVDDEESATPPSDPETPVVVRPTAPPDAPADACRRGRRNICRELRIGGGVALGLGIAGLAAGIGLAAVGNEPLDDLPAYQRAYRPAGAAIIPVAVVLVVAGALLIVKAVRTERGRRRGRAR